MRLWSRLGALALALALAALAGPALGQANKVSKLPACVDGGPGDFWVVDGASATDCSTGLGTYDVHCCCADGSWSSCASAGGSGWTRRGMPGTAEK